MEKMPSYHSSTLTEEYQALSTLPLPESAVVIDVRHSEVTDRPLLTFLNTEIEDLSREMHQHQVPGWSQLVDCVRFLKLDAVPPGVPLNEFTDFIVTLPAGKQIPLAGWPNLVSYLGHTCIDEVRDERVRAMLTHDTAKKEDTIDTFTIRPATVRVFFLTDMNEGDSLTRAAIYTQWLKEWMEQTHGDKRFDRDERIQTIVICLNTDAAHSQAILLQTLGALPQTAIDTVILLQTYSNDETHIDEDEQIYHTELLLYSLLLHWPAVFIKSIEDASHMSPHFIQAARVFPWPTYTIGIAAMEYSARWAARWLDYGVARQLLAVINDAQPVEREAPLLKQRMQQWLEKWWQEMQDTVPDSIISEVNELQAFAHLQNVTRPSTILKSTPRTVARNLEAFHQQVNALYIGNGIGTLQYAMKSSPAALFEQFKEVSRHASSYTQDNPDEHAVSYEHLAALYTSTQQCIPTHFQEAWGALPRAIRQLSALAEPIAAIRSIAFNPPDLKIYREQFEQQVHQASTTLTKKYSLWRLPLVGSVLCSTVLCWLLIGVLGLILLVGVNWQNLLASTPAEFSLRQSTQLALLIWKGLLLILLIGAAWLYLATRRKAFRNDCLRTHRVLCQLIATHTARVKSVIAAQLALTFLQQADLYQSDVSVSPYEQRLREFEQTLKKLQAQASSQYEVAHSRLQYLTDERLFRSMPDIPPFTFHNRREVILWQHIEDALLQAHKELRSDTATFNLLAEMLLRRLGTEHPAELLNDMLNKQRWITDKSAEGRFQALETLFVVLALVLPSVQPEPADLLPLLQQYMALKEFYQKEPATPGNSPPDLALLVRESLLEHIQERPLHTAMPLVEKRPVIHVLASWISGQRDTMPRLTAVFTSNDVLAHLENTTMQPSQIIDTLLKQGASPEYPDELSGEDSFYLFFAPGEASSAFLQRCQSLQQTQIHMAPFPDREKLVYLHVHRIRQLLPTSAKSTIR
jgi:hypothetical protein